MYVTTQSVLDAAEDADLYWHYMEAERNLLAEQRQERWDRLTRRNKALHAMHEEGESYSSYAERARHYIAMHEAVKSVDEVIARTTERLFKYSAKHSN